ncbi:MAG: hypothetical protein EU535_06400 [Promethearchaeota archaeon]|nr:MAG: hypothetical protein EU535_06400 [Candidatus Lokiarchaeota archaeon]
MKHIQTIFGIFLIFIIFGFGCQMSFFNQESLFRDTNLNSSSPSNSINLEWTSIWGSNNNEYCNQMVIDSSGNIFVIGWANYSSMEDYDIFLAKFNSLGEIQWNRTFGGDGWDLGNDVELDSSENVYITGNLALEDKPSDGFLVKYNSLGEYQWNKTWGGDGRDFSNALALDSNDNIYIVGFTEIEPFNYDFILLKYNSLGEYQWNRTFGGEYYDYGSGIAIDSMNNIYVSGGNVVNTSFQSDILLLKYDNSGVLKWNKTWNKGTQKDDGIAIVLDSSQNIYITGSTSISTSIDMVLLKYDNAGEYVWNRTWGTLGGDTTTDITIDGKNNIFLSAIVNGMYLGNFTLIYYNINGEQKYNYTWGGLKTDQARAITVDTFGNIFMTGFTDSFGSGDFDVYLAKFSGLIDEFETFEIIGYDLSLIFLCFFLVAGFIVKKKFNRY